MRFNESIKRQRSKSVISLVTTVKQSSFWVEDETPYAIFASHLHQVKLVLLLGLRCYCRDSRENVERERKSREEERVRCYRKNMLALLYCLSLLFQIFFLFWFFLRGNSISRKPYCTALLTKILHRIQFKCSIVIIFLYRGKFFEIFERFL